MHSLGRRQVDYGAVEAHYGVAGQTLLRCLAEVAGDAWSPELETAWAAAYGVIQETMLQLRPS